jgi:hypothetical protein
MMQLSSINAIACFDINGDGYADIVAGGNEFGFLPQFGRLDESFGHIAINNGKGQFSWMPPKRTGIELRGQIRDIKKLNAGNQTCLLFLQNNEYPVLYEVNNHAKSKLKINK